MIPTGEGALLPIIPESLPPVTSAGRCEQARWTAQRMLDATGAAEVTVTLTDTTGLLASATARNAPWPKNVVSATYHTPHGSVAHIPNYDGVEWSGEAWIAHSSYRQFSPTPWRHHDVARRYLDQVAAEAGPQQP